LPENKSAQCEEKTRLVSEYNRATTIFSDAVEQLHKRIGTSSKDEYESLTRATEDARMQAEEARLMMERHVKDHGC